MQKKILLLFSILAYIIFCNSIVYADTEKTTNYNIKIEYDEQKNISTSGTKPPTLSSNCRDAVAGYWSKTTTVANEGDNSGSIYDTSNIVGAPSQEMANMAAKALAMAQKGGILYRQSGRQVANTEIELDQITQTDCSAFVGSLYKVFLGFYPGAWPQSEQMKTYGENNQVCDGWTANFYSFSGDTSVLLPGDILYRSGHVGLYVGNGMQVDHGGPGGANSQSNPNWTGPKHRSVSQSNYTHYIRWSNPNATPVKDFDYGSSIASYSAKPMPSGKPAIDNALDTMADIEIMARLIYGEQRGQSFESQVIVGISVLNRGNNIKEVAKAKYADGSKYQYNCVEGASFWGAIPEETVKAAQKAIEAKKTGTYKVVDCRTSNSIETIGVHSFHAAGTVDFPNSWNGGILQVVLYNKGMNNYTGFYA